MKFDKMYSTKILATAGPTMFSVEQIIDGINAGASDFRLHLGSRDRDVCKYMFNIREAERILNKKVDVVIDLPSSRPRVSDISYRELNIGERLTITNYSKSDGVTNAIPIPGIDRLLGSLKVGERLLFRDGKITLVIREIDMQRNEIIAECTASSSRIGQGCSCVMPDSNVTYDPIVDLDIDSFERLRDNGLYPDWIVMSFASSKRELQELKNVINEYWPNRNIGIIAKIENSNGLINFDEILEYSDGIMIGRGDLALHIDPIKLPVTQTILAKKCYEAEKVCIIATEFLERFATTNVISRPELTDLACAVRQKATSIMLSMESANSKYPVESIKLAKSVINAEIEYLSMIMDKE